MIQAQCVLHELTPTLMIRKKAYEPTVVIYAEKAINLCIHCSSWLNLKSFECTVVEKGWSKE